MENQSKGPFCSDVEFASQAAGVRLLVKLVNSVPVEVAVCSEMAGL